MKTGLCRAMLLLVAGLTPAAHAASVVNGSFENYTGAFDVDGAAAIDSGSSALTGWSVISSIAIIKNGNDYALSASQGQHFLDLTGYLSPGSGVGNGVQQTLTGLDVGTLYQVSFDLGIRNGNCGVSGAFCGGPIVVTAAVGSQSQSFGHDPVELGNVWSRNILTFAADSATPTLQFTIASVQGVYVGLDNVTIAAVPEPSAALMLLAGGGLLGLGRRLRGRNAPSA